MIRDLQQALGLHQNSRSRHSTTVSEEIESNIAVGGGCLLFVDRYTRRATKALILSGTPDRVETVATNMTMGERRIDHYD